MAIREAIRVSRDKVMTGVRVVEPKGSDWANWPVVPGAPIGNLRGGT